MTSDDRNASMQPDPDPDPEPEPDAELNDAPTPPKPAAWALPKFDLPKVQPAWRFDTKSLYPELSATIDAIQKATLPDLAKFRRIQRAVTRNSAFAVKIRNPSLFQFSANASKIAKLYTPPPGWTEALRRALLPSPNLQEVEGLSLVQVDDLARTEGICLLYVPRSAIVQELIDAEDPVARRQVLTDHADDIFDDCTAQLDMCANVELSGFVPAMRQAIGAAQAGFMMPAQSLAASVIDSVLNLAYDKETYDMVKWRDKLDGQPKDSLNDLDVRSGLVFSALWQVYMQFWPHKGDPIPETFARHGSAHAVDPVQYTPANTVHAIMLGTSLLRFTNDLTSSEVSEPRQAE